MTSTQNIAMIGGGSWATALIKVLTDNGHHVRWWMRDPAQAEHLQQHHNNPKYISSVDFAPELITASTDLRATLEKAQIVILAVPAAFLHGVLEEAGKELLIKRTIFSAVKGIIPHNLKIVGEHLHDEFGVAYNDLGVICGPCHAEEVAQEKLSYLTIASQDEPKAEAMAMMLNSRYIKTTLSDDIHGTEYGAILKNVIALAAGIYHGLGYGDNFHAVLMSRGIQEMERFIAAVHPISRDINDPAYLGDLLVTAYSQFSRNRLFGTYIGKGYSVRAAQMEMNMVAEGYYAVKGVHELNANLGVRMPICDAVFNVCYGNASPRRAMQELADRLS